MTNIKRIQKEMLDGVYRNNPAGCAEAKTILAGEYSFLAGSLEEILSRRAAVWNEIRPKFKSDASCFKAYEQTEDGVNEMVLRLRMKSVEKMMSALSSLLKVAEGEAMGNH